MKVYDFRERVHRLALCTDRVMVIGIEIYIVFKTALEDITYIFKNINMESYLKVFCKMNSNSNHVCLVSSHLLLEEFDILDLLSQLIHWS